MKIEMNINRLLIEAETMEERKLLNEYLEDGRYLTRLRLFLELDLQETPTTSHAIPTPREETEGRIDHV